MTKVCGLPPLAISIRQPWVHCILEHGKNIENRSWPTKFRGHVCLHAAKGMKVGEFNDCMDFVDDILPLDSQMAVASRRASALDASSIHRRGGIVAIAQIVDCVTSSKSPWFMGQYGFVLYGVVPVDFVPVRGSLGFFDWRKNLSDAEVPW